MSGVAKASKMAVSQLEAIRQNDPQGVDEIRRVVDVLRRGGWVAGLGWRRGSWRIARAGRYELLYRPLAAKELEYLRASSGILIGQVLEVGSPAGF